MTDATIGGPGWKTSEFWLTLLGNLVGILGIAKGYVPPPYNGYVMIGLAALNSVYTVARSYVKQVNPAVTTVAGPAVTTTTTTKP